MKTIRIALVPTSRTDLLCVGCGRFLVHEKGFALVGKGQSDTQAEAGLHKRCLPAIKAEVVRKPKPRNASASDPQAEQAHP